MIQLSDSMAQISDSLTCEGAKKALRDHAERVALDPLTNSVFALAVHYFHGLEAGTINVSDLQQLSQDVGRELLEQRADRFRAQHNLHSTDGFSDHLNMNIRALSASGWDAFRSELERERGGIVFTGHPTFALPKVMRDALAEYVANPTDGTRDTMRKAAGTDSDAWARSITLGSEHAEAQSAVHHAQRAMGMFLDRILKVAREAFPDQWRTLRPFAPTIASWVGYDLDGRTDIQWTHSLAFRLQEKAAQLGRYRILIDEILSAHGPNTMLVEMREKIARAATLTATQQELIANVEKNPKDIVAAANAITGDHPDRLTDANVVISSLDGVINHPDTTDSLAADLIRLQSIVRAHQLGTAHIHLRLNAAQMTSVIRRDLDLATDTTDLGRLVMATLADKIKGVRPISVSFADLHFEQSTARRQFMMCAVLLRHIDAGSPIRFLIAESENPATVLGALYLARLYAVDHQLDISPLFETPDALSTGNRFMDRLLEEQVFRDYVNTRGYLSIQLGFSDAGRFVGQVPANMAIERLHNLIGKALADRISNIDLLIFNTHGESIGRGAFPGSFEQRFDHLLTPWTRRQNSERGLHIRHEMSFQGGDGFLHFANAQLADATYSAVCDHLLFPKAVADEDPFYQQTDFVWDFYRALKAWQEDMLNRPAYENLLSDFAAGFLVRAGSRQTRRGGARGPRSLRAISHNATLHQLSVPLNSCAGFGSALPKESDRLANLINASPRMRHLLDLALAARLVTSVPSLRAYAQVYSPTLWSGLAYQATTDEQRNKYIRVYSTLREKPTAFNIMSIADTLAVDMLAFDTLLARINSAPPIKERHEKRLPLHVLHAIRQALMMRALVIAGRLPRFSDRHVTNIDDVIDMVQGMYLDDAVSALAAIFPASIDPENAFDDLQDLTDSDDIRRSYGYDQVHRDIIAPLRETAAMLRSISLSLCHAYGAYG